MAAAIAAKEACQVTVAVLVIVWFSVFMAVVAVMAVLTEPVGWHD